MMTVSSVTSAHAPHAPHAPHASNRLIRHERQRSLRRWCVVAASLVASGCGGGGGDEPVIVDPPKAVAIERLTLEAPSTAVEVGDTVALTATFTRTVNAAVAAQVVNPATTTYQSSDPAIATVRAEAGVARVVAIGVGQVTITATYDTLRATRILLTGTPSITAARFAAEVVVVPAGRSVTPVVELTGRSGRPVTARYTLSLLGVTGAAPSVQIDGTAMTASAGTRTAVLVLTAESRQDTLQVLVASAAPSTVSMLALTQPFVRLGVPFVVPDAGATEVQVAGAVANRIAATGSSATFALPTAPFGTCLPGGARLPLRITTPAGAWILDMPALNPHRMTIPTNDVQYPFAQIDQGCLIAVDAGTYDVQFYRWDLDFDRLNLGKNPAAPYVKSNAEPVALWQRRIDRVTELDAPAVTAGSASVTAPQNSVSRDVSAPTSYTHVLSAAPNAIRAQFARALATRQTMPKGTAAADFTQPTWRSTSGGTCAIPTTVGDSILLFTERLNGRVNYLPGDPRATSIEPWVLVGVSPKVAVFVDTTFARTLLPTSRTAIGQFVAAYDSTVVGWFASQGLPIPDADGTGRMVVLLPDMLGNATSLSTYYGRPDCPFTSAPVAEAIAIPLGFGTDGVAARLSAAVHEVMHVSDIAGPGRSVSRGRAMWWVQEGFAVLGEWLWAYAPTGDPLNARATVRFSPRVIEGAAAGPTCARPTRAQLAGWFSFSPAGYDLACQFLAWAVRGGIQPGVSQATVMSRLLMAQEKSTMRDVLAAVRGTTAAEFPRVIGDFFAAFTEPSAGAVPRPDLLFGPVNLGTYVAAIPYALMTPVPAGNGLPPVRDQIGEVDLQVMRATSTQELLLEVRVPPGSVPARVGVGIRRR